MIFDLALNESAIYSDPGVYFLGYPGQDRMEGASTSVCKFDRVVRGHRGYKTD